MGRPPLSVGTYGRISYTTPSDGRVVARTTYRDADGHTREVTRRGNSRADAERKLKDALTTRRTPSTHTGVGPETRVSDLAKRWLASIQGSSRAVSTKRLYELAVNRYVVPHLGGLRLRETNVIVIDHAIAVIARENGTGAAKTARSVLSGIFRLAVRYGALDGNPVRDATPIPRATRRTVRALTRAEADALLSALHASPRAIELDLPDLVEFMLGTGVRIGEACAVRDEVLDLSRGTVEINATVIRATGAGLMIQPRTKSEAGWRILALPRNITAIIERRRSTPHLRAPHGVLFPSPMTKLRDPSNTQADLREVLATLGATADSPTPFAWVTSHVFRKTVATRLDEAGQSARVIADVLGHAKPSMTQDVYMGRNVVSAEAAQILDRPGFP